MSDDFFHCFFEWEIGVVGERKEINHSQRIEISQIWGGTHIIHALGVFNVGRDDDGTGGFSDVGLPRLDVVDQQLVCTGSFKHLQQEKGVATRNRCFIR